MPDTAVPQLAPAPAAALLDLERRILDGPPAIERWFRMQWQEHTPPFCGSVDVRNAGFKLAPVDMNLFPGGWNNLADTMLPCAVQAAQGAVEHWCPDARNLLLIPERHTRNTWYSTNVARLARILRTAGLEVRIGSLSDEVAEPTTLDLPSGETLRVEPLARRGARLGIASDPSFSPCVVLLNNDLSAGVPELLRGLTEQVVVPPLHGGWAVRRKSLHFAAYDEVAADFARLLSIDPWLVNPYFARCGQVDFHAREGEDCLRESVDLVLTRIRAKYAEYGITDKPFVIVKADAGTYGMGIMTVRDASEVIGLNRKQRNKMAVVKEGLEVRDAIIQESVPTRETVGDGTAEPVVYMIARYVVGGFYRVNKARGVDENLNAPGMEFAPLPFAQSGCLPHCGAMAGSAPENRFYCYGVIGSLALLAAAIELERTAPLLPEAPAAPEAEPAE